MLELVLFKMIDRLDPGLICRKKNSTQSLNLPFLIQLIFQIIFVSAQKIQIWDANAVSPEDPMAGTRA